MSSNRRGGAVEVSHSPPIVNIVYLPCVAGTAQIGSRNPSNYSEKHSPASHRKLNLLHPPSVARKVIFGSITLIFR